MKGISLPINTIVIVAIAVLVMVVLAAFFSGMFIPSTIEMKREQAMSKACNQWILSYNCNDNGYSDIEVSYTDPSIPDQTKYTLEELCAFFVGMDNIAACRLKCACPVQQTTTT